MTGTRPLNIVLLYPKMPDTFYALKHLNHIVGKKASFPPLGLLTVASMLPKEWNKRLVDLNVRELTDDDLAWADYVLLSAMNVQELSVREVIAQCTARGVPIVAGGPLFTHEYERFPEIDHFVLNEAEITLPDFLTDLRNGTPRRIYRSDAFADISTTPLPEYELIDLDDYLYAIIQYSRGCPYLCDFCDVTTLFGRRPRVKTSEHIIRELELIRQHSSVRLVLFADDNLIGNKRTLKQDLLPALIEWRQRTKPSFFFATQLTINLTDDAELMEMLLQAGFRSVFIGIETVEEEGLKASLKNQNLRRDQLENIRILHKAGFIVYGGFIVGFDTDTARSFRSQIEFIQQSGIPLPIVNLLKAPPGTELFERIKREGRLSRPFAFAEGETNIVPAMAEKELFDGFLSVISSVYEPHASFERMVRFLEEYRYPVNRIRTAEKVTLQELVSLLRVVMIVGIRYTHRQYFWRLLWWSIRNRMRYIDKAFFYGILIYQMHQTYLHIRQTVHEQNPHLYPGSAAGLRTA